MYKDAFAPAQERLGQILDRTASDPLDVIEAALLAFVSFLDDESSPVRQLYEVIVLRCEDVDEFCGAKIEVDKMALVCKENLERVYLRAADAGTLVPGLDPLQVAQDTHIFAYGLLHLALARPAGSLSIRQIATMIAGHLQLRRCPLLQSHSSS